MAIGGFNGTDPSPTLAQFEQDVAKHKIHYFIAGGGGFGGGPGRAERLDVAGAITSWVASNFTAQTVGGVTVYDLTHVARASVKQRGIRVERLERLEAVGAVTARVAGDGRACSG